jgi:tRNA(fMet)-specific endonuclease VapC
MIRYILDTNIILHYIRASSLYKRIEKDHQLTNPNSTILISIVSKAELLSIGKQRNWENPEKLKKLNEGIDNSFIVIDITNDKALLQAYSEIDAYSQGKLTGRPLNSSARNMGKNDLWIAATASVTNSTLITTDQDYDHLNGSFLNVIKISNED